MLCDEPIAPTDVPDTIYSVCRSHRFPWGASSPSRGRNTRIHTACWWRCSRKYNGVECALRTRRNAPRWVVGRDQYVRIHRQTPRGAHSVKRNSHEVGGMSHSSCCEIAPGHVVTRRGTMALESHELGIIDGCAGGPQANMIGCA